MKQFIPILALYWGARIRFDYLVDGKKMIVQNAVVNAETLSLIEEHEVNNLFLYLRSLKDLQPKQILHIAQLVTEDTEVKFEYEEFEGGISVFNKMYWIDIHMNPFNVIASYAESGEEYIPANLITVIDYLRVNHYDLNGLIDRGLAVEII